MTYLTRWNDIIYVSDNTHKAIRAIDTKAGTMSSRVACGTTLNLHKVIRTGQDGTLYVADKGNNRIVSIAPGFGATTAFTTLAGTGGGGFSQACTGPATSCGLSGPWGLAIDTAMPRANVYFSEHPDGNMQSTVRRVDGATGVLTYIAGTFNVQGYAGDGQYTSFAGALFNAIATMLFVAPATLVVADQRNGRIRALTGLAPTPTPFVDTVVGAGGVATGGGGDGGAANAATVFLPSYGSWAPDGVTAVFAGTLWDGVAGLPKPGSFSFSSPPPPTHHLLPLDTGNYRFRAFNTATNMMSAFAGNGGATSSGNGNSIFGPLVSFFGQTGGGPRDAIFNGGTWFLSDNNAHTIRSVNASTGVISALTGRTGMSGATNGAASSATYKWPNSLAYWAPTDTLIISDAGNNLLRKLDMATMIVTTYATLLGSPHCIRFDAVGNLFAALGPPSPSVLMIAAGSSTPVRIAGNGSVGYAGDGGLALNAMFANLYGIGFDETTNVSNGGTL